jgi:hypothetical protein
LGISRVQKYHMPETREDVPSSRSAHMITISIGSGMNIN